MKDSTILIKEKVDFSTANPISTPIFQTSAFHSGDPNFYTRNTNPNFEELENLLVKLDNASYSVVLSSGMAAISSVIHLLKPGDELIFCSLIYGCTYRLLTDFCHKMDIKLFSNDFSDIKLLEKKVTNKTSMIFFETPTNPFLKTINIDSISSLLKSKNPCGLVVVDNTWATPINQKPLNFGADISLYSGSKFFSGHSDVIIGAVCTKNKDIYESIKKYRFYHGSVPDAFSAWLTRRGMQTLEVRLTRHNDSTNKVIEYLEKHPLVSRTYYPNIDGSQLKAYGCLLFFKFKVSTYAEVKRFMDCLTLFDQGTSMASISSAVANPYNGSHLSMNIEEKKSIGLDEFIVRLSIGLEDVDDLINDLDKAFSILSS